MKHSVDFLGASDDPPAKRAIQKAALELFVRDGVCETSIRALADASGFTNPALFKHFQSKGELVTRLFSKCYLYIAGLLDEAMLPDASFRENLHRILVAYANLLDDGVEAFLFVQEHVRTYWGSMPKAVQRRSMITRLRNLLAAGVEEGVVADDVDLTLLVASVSGVLQQFARMHYLGSIGGSARGHVPHLETVITRMLQSAP